MRSRQSSLAGGPGQKVYLRLQIVVLLLACGACGRRHGDASSRSGGHSTAPGRLGSQRPTPSTRRGKPKAQSGNEAQAGPIQLREYVSSVNTSQQAGVSTCGGVLLFLGTSVSAGYGLKAGQSYPSLIERQLAATGYNMVVVTVAANGSLANDGANLLRRYRGRSPTIIVLELGANDALQHRSLATIRRGLEASIDSIRARYPKASIVIEGMSGDTDYEDSYGQRLARMYRDVAIRNRARLVPGLMRQIVGRRRFVQADGIHPNARAHRIIANRVWARLGPLVREAEHGTSLDHSGRCEAAP